MIQHPRLKIDTNLQKAKNAHVMTRNTAHPDTNCLEAPHANGQFRFNAKGQIMKRTEKVEIRVSLEEKQALSHLAKQEGESVSGLIRGLIEKYMALNIASTKRRLPKWKIATGLIIAAFIGHGLTLLPMHLHSQGHQRAEMSPPIYMVHGAIDNDAFGVSVHADDRIKEFTIQGDTPVKVKLSFSPRPEDGGILKVVICELGHSENCEAAFKAEMDIERIAPSVLGNNTKSGKPIHIFVQEMA